MTQNHESLRDEIDSLRERVSKLESALQGGENRARGVHSLRSLYDEFGPSSHFERALVIGYYLEHGGGKDGFTTEDLREGYITCKTPLPANLSDTIAKVGKKDWAMPIGEEDGRRVWQLTSEGEQIVQEQIEEEA
jgi:hypothetical protein